MAEQDDAMPTVAGRLALAQRAGGLAGPHDHDRRAVRAGRDR